MTLDQSILGMRLRVMRRAQELGNASAACREAGISRTRFYRWRHRLERYGPDGLHPRRRQARPGRPPQVPPHVERLVVGVSLAWPTWGCGRLAAHLRHQGLAQVAPSTVQRILRRAGLPTRRQRLTVLEHHSAQTMGLLTDRSRRQLQRTRPGPPRHVEATTPGELVCLDTFYIGKLKGVGQVWQLTACDAACSYGVARLLPALSAEGSASFLREVLVPLYRRAGWPLRRVLTDWGSEFKGAFDHACRARGIRHTRTRPRHAWTNGFVERLQGTILQEHWRIQFRRRYFTRRAALEQTLQAFLRFYNTQRPHQGYRLRGRTPAALFWGAAAAKAS
jgi:transposase InsO family protein